MDGRSRDTAEFLGGCHLGPEWAVAQPTTSPGGNVDDFLKWCGQFREFEYSTVSYWVTAFKRGDGMDMYDRRLQRKDGSN